MKRIFTLLSIALLMAVAQDASAQMSKNEKKEWKKIIKSLTPEQYKSLLEENKSIKGELSKLKKEASSIDGRIKDKDKQIADYQDQIANLRRDLVTAKKQGNSGASPSSSSRRSSRSSGKSTQSTVSTKGVYFKVQIGAFKKKDLRKFAQNNPSFDVDDKDGTYRYTIGAFKDYWEADTFKKYLREMGVKGAWIVAYKDGKRVPIKQVLEGI